MSTETKTQKSQCISLKADRTQCIRYASDASQFCWQHAKGEQKYGTISAPAPEKPKSNRGRPKGTTAKKNLVIVSSSAPITSTSEAPSISSSEAPNPPNKIDINLNPDLFKNINWNITGNPLLDQTIISNVPFELSFDIGGETHISLPKLLKFEGVTTMCELHIKILEFFKTEVTQQDYDKLIEICNDVENDELAQIYTDMSEDDKNTYADLQLGLDKLQSIVVRDSKYVAIMGEN